MGHVKLGLVSSTVPRKQLTCTDALELRELCPYRVKVHHSVIHHGVKRRYHSTQAVRSAMACKRGGAWCVGLGACVCESAYSHVVSCVGMGIAPS